MSYMYDLGEEQQPGPWAGGYVFPKPAQASGGDILSMIGQGENIAAKTAQDVLNIIGKKPISAQPIKKPVNWTLIALIGGAIVLGLAFFASRKKEG